MLASLPFLIISLDTLTLVSTNPLETGTHVITLTVGLQDYPAVLPIVKTFKAIIYCETLQVDVIKKPALSSYTIELDLELLIDFEFNSFPDCGLTYSLNATYPFLSIYQASK